MGLILGTQQLAANVTQPYPDHGLKRTPIKVALLSLPPRTQSLLEFFFTNAGRGSFVACSEEQSETAIFDLDTPNSRDHWLLYHGRTGRAGIALAVKSQDVPGALWVQKPVTPAALLAAAASLRAAGTAPLSAGVQAPAPSSLSAEPVANAAAPEAAQLKSTWVDPQPPHQPPSSSPEPGPVAVTTPVETRDPAPVAATPAADPVGLSPTFEVASPPQEAPAPAADESAAPADAIAVSAPPLDPAAISIFPPAPASTTANFASAPEVSESGKSFWKRLFGTTVRKPAETARSRPSVSAPSLTDAPAKDAEIAPAPVSTPSPVAESSLPAQASDVRDEPMAVETATAAESTPNPPETQAVAIELQRAVAAQLTDAGLGSETVTPSRETAFSESAVTAEDAAVVAAPAEDTATTASGPAAAQASPTTADPAADVDSAFQPTEPAEHPVDAKPFQTLGQQDPTDSTVDALFGNRADVPAKELGESAALRFDPEKHLVGVLREAFMVATKWEVPTQFDCGVGFMVVDAERNELHSSLDDAGLQALASTPLGKRTKVQTLSSLEYVRFKQALQESGKARCTRLDDAIWRSAMWASAGRLPAGTNPSRTVFLRQWPNLTRITPTPQAPRLAAMWALRGGNILDTCRQFNLPQRHVIAFYNGVWALNLLTEDGSFARRTQRKGARNRGLLTRLLGWLRR